MQMYEADVVIRGTSNLLFKAWNPDVIEEKSKAHKKSRRKCEDNPEEMVYRDENGNLALPGEHLRMAIVNAGKSHRDPRSSRKSCYDLLKAVIIVEPELANLNKQTWDYLDRRRVRIQPGSCVTRVRPALYKGWKAAFTIKCLAEQYISPEMLLTLLNEAGLLCGVGDFRPTFGRFEVLDFKVKKSSQ